MLMATIAILPAAVARLPFAFIQQYGPLAFFGLSVLIFKIGEYFARKAGKIDMTTSY